MSDIKIAEQSLKEEKQAIEDYTHRKKLTSDSELRKALTHALSEEKEHAQLFTNFLNKDMQVQNSKEHKPEGEGTEGNAVVKKAKKGMRNLGKTVYNDSAIEKAKKLRGMD